MPRTRVVKSTTIIRSGSTSSDYRLWLWAVVLGCLALLFVIISVAAPGWLGRHLIKDYGKVHLTTIVLSFMAIFFLLLAIISTILFATRLITSFSSGIKLSAIILFTLAGVCIVAAYTSFSVHIPNHYSYYLMVTSGIFTFISAIIVSFWLGRHWIIV
ncbi:unnamed protein product [Rotaria socialis]|uniref:Uncharacterized protein n=2 Tax=Rotaria TaxID=231623 RepID=A0A816VPB0_9BILA|nr:unnamed protein product [Rotaria magnacalcarata]CAF3222810.1 unnamed protein product [Rotaria socialis]CAF1640212.1 unnamed protein product [Rotaria magnacalcarata]CAF2110872.1 unnamed protein product [Rotaria magnacalcarata]CAF2123187.1 unnamed protein product [Rotaria magnacalcarata]